MCSGRGRGWCRRWGGRGPAMRLRSVDLPEPEEPRRARNSLLATERVEFVDGADGSFAHGVVAGDAVELDGGIGGGHRDGVRS